jgi:NAD(P)-dependent dehydrogenase (short-subunit alcohol dehydrogenase family)
MAKYTAQLANFLSDFLNEKTLLTFVIVLLVLYLLKRRFIRVKEKKWTRPDAYKGQVVLVTGGSSGIGSAMALYYAQKEAKVVVAARNEQALRQVANACKLVGAEESLAWSCDVTSEDDCRKLVEHVVAHFGGIDILVLSAGRGALIDFEKANLREYRELMDTNYWGAVYPTYYALKTLRQRKGKIIVISSIVGKIGVPHRTGYSPTKHALHGFFDSLRYEVGNDIQITIACPGYVASPFHEKAVGVQQSSQEGSQRQRDYSKYMTMSACAEKIARAEQEGAREVIFPWRNRVAVFAKYCLPHWVMDELILSGEKNGFKETEDE